MAKTRNDRRFSGGGARPDLTDAKRSEGAERQAAYDALSTAEKLARLDAMFGKGLGAAKERQKLVGSKAAVAKEPVADADASATLDKVRLKAKDRRAQESGEE